MTNPDIMIFEYRGPSPGPHLLILGAVHGNEPCGTIGLARLRLELDLGLLKLATGRLTIAPVCNPEAYRQRQRFIAANLNRIVSRHARPGHAEHRCANALVDLIEGCDVLLDLHSYAGGHRPFLFLDYPTPANRALAEALDIGHWVVGWPDLYDKNPALSSGDTVSCAHGFGKTGILVECGYHDDPAAAGIAYRSLRRTLDHLGMMSGEGESVASEAPHICRVERVILRDREGGFAKPWSHLDAITAGEPVIHYADGTALAAPCAGVILLPNAAAGLGQEWLYLGRPAE